MSVQGKAAQEELYNILESQIDLYGNKSLVIENDDIFINFDLVSYDYDSNSKILKDTSINIRGNNTALGGTNGVGKSTIGKPIVRLYTPDSRSIEINGQNLIDISEKSVSKSIIYVDGRESLFSFSMSDNTKLGRSTRDEDIYDMLSKLKVNSIFQNLDFENISDKQLSLGQMQIIKVLRAILSAKKIHIFDEITNGSDECIKQNVVNYLFGLKGMKIFITYDKEVTSKCEKEYTVKDMKIMRRR